VRLVVLDSIGERVVTGVMVAVVVATVETEIPSVLVVNQPGVGVVVDDVVAVVGVSVGVEVDDVDDVCVVFVEVVGST
jgi:hypothetical protein